MDNSGYLYVIKYESNAAVKVGKTIRPNNRISALKSGTLDKLQINHLIKCDDCYLAYKEIVKKIRKYRIKEMGRCRWYILPDEILTYLTKMEKYEPEKQLNRESDKIDRLVYENVALKSIMTEVYRNILDTLRETIIKVDGGIECKYCIFPTTLIDKIIRLYDQKNEDSKHAKGE